MNKEEILRYINLGSKKSICVDRQLLKDYPGFVRDIIIFSETMLKVEFNIFECDEGGVSIKVHYDDFDKLLLSIEDYVRKPSHLLINITQNGWYPILEQEVDYNESGLKLKRDLANNTLLLPNGGSQYDISDGYWKDVYEGNVDV